MQFKSNFTDTNIVLGKISKYDPMHESCEKYFNQDYDNYTSFRVKKESVNVLKNSLSLYDEIFNYLYGNLNLSKINLADIDSEIKKIKKNFVRNYHNDEFPFNFSKSSFYNRVDLFFNRIAETIKKSILYIDFTHLSQKHEEIRNNYFECYVQLLNFINELNTCPNYTENYKNKVLLDNLLKIDDIHKSDAEILLDSNELEGSVVFITNDRGILKNTSNIKKLFKKDFDIHNVYYFLN